MPKPRAYGARVAAIMLALLAFALLPARADDKGSLHWKSVDGAQVKLDDKTPLAWDVYQLDKKKQPNLALVLLGRRYILVDYKAKLAYAVFLEQIQKQGNDITSEDLALSTHVIPSVAWTVRDVGPAEEIKFTLNDYGRTLSVQLPHPIDIRLGVY